MKALTDRIACGTFFILGLLVIVESLRLSLGDIHNPGPGFVPFFLGLSMSLLSVLAFSAPDLRLNEDAFWNNWQRGKNILLIFAGLILYMLLFKALGFLVDTFWLMVYLMRLAGAESDRQSVLVALLTMLVIYVVFYRLLIIPFPRGILGL